MRGKINIRKGICVILSIIMIIVNFTNTSLYEAYGEDFFDVNNYDNISLKLSKSVYVNDILNISSEIDKIKDIQKDEEFRESIEYLENEIMFIRKETRKVSFEAEYLTNEDDISKKNQLSNIEIIDETINSIIDEYVEYYVTYKARTKLDVWTVIDTMNEEDDIICAEPNYIFKNSITSVPTEENTLYMNYQWYLDELNMKKNWKDMYAYGLEPGAGVNIAILDTGVKLKHNALKGALWVNKYEIPNNSIDDDNNGYIDDINGVNMVNTQKAPEDDNGHGTHVAGIIGMQPGQSGVGIAYGAKIMPIKAGDKEGNFQQSSIIKGINYAIQMGADIINMSFAGGYSSSVEVAVKSAYNKNIILVAATGNEGAPTSEGAKILGAVADVYDNYPAGSSYVLGVMAHTKYETLADFSNWDYKEGSGAEYDLIAPGAMIFSSYNGNNDDYEFSQGTSMAAPMVAAMLACYRTIYSSKDLYKNEYLYNKIKSNNYITYKDAAGGIHKFKKMNTDLLSALEKKDKIDIAACKITLSSSAYYYDGKSKKPSVTVKYGYTTLKQNEKFKVSYGTNKNIGTGSVVIEGISSGNCYGKVTKTINILPPKVKGLKIAAFNTNAIKVKWNKNAYATGYELYRYNSSKKKYERIKRYNSNTSLTYLDKSLVSGTTYYYKVRCFKLVNGTRIYSGSSSAVKGSTTPSKAKLTYNSYSSSSIKLQWGAVIGASGYQIYRYNSKLKKYVRIKNVSASTRSFTDNGLKTRTKYLYTVRAYKKWGKKYLYGGFANKTSAFCGPKAPSKLTGKKSGNNKILLKWNKVSYASGYEIYISKSKNKNYLYVCSVGKSYLGAIISNVPKGKIYYKVRAYSIYNGKKVYSSFIKPISVSL